MAEYTIPKPYRDFYVTNPYIELKESNERLQRIVKSGYVATDSFEGVNNQLITFDKEKHGFSLTNDASKASSWTIDLSDSSSWVQGSIANDTGELINHPARIRTSIKIPVMVGQTYSFNSQNTTTYQAWIACFDKYNTKLNALSFSSLPRTITIPESTDYILIVVRAEDSATNFTPDDFLSVAGKLSFSVSTYTAPSDVTVKVAENVAGVPTTADGWEQGGLNYSTGGITSSNYLIRTKEYIPISDSKRYTLKFAFSTTNYSVRVFLYNKDKTLATYSNKIGATKGEYSFVTNENTGFIRFVFSENSDAEITPSIISNLTKMVVISDTMIVQENDTRIVTMPPFTSLYIESNVPYHGHALDLAE